MFSVDDAALPLLRVLSDGVVRRNRDLCALMADHFGLSEAERRDMVPSGTQARYRNRTNWALVNLVMAGLLEQPSRGQYEITAAGRKLLATNPERLSNRFLREYSEEFRNWDTSGSPTGIVKSTPANGQTADADEAATPEELMATAATALRHRLAGEILAAVLKCSPAFFEQLVVQLLIKLGYGGSVADVQSSVVGKSGDGGIDGIIKEDRLGLDAIYVQAKRWQNTVGRPEIQTFAGALLGRGARKGVFITTSSYTREAREFAAAVPNATVVLIDGRQLADYMIETGLGVTLEQTYEIKRLDSDFFEG